MKRVTEINHRIKKQAIIPKTLADRQLWLKILVLSTWCGMLTCKQIKYVQMAFTIAVITLLTSVSVKIGGKIDKVMVQTA